MFTLLVSWLLVACVPALLMLATLGLGRLERELASDTVTATEVADFLSHAEPVDVHTLAREGMPEALDYLHRRQAQRIALQSRPVPLPGPRTGRHHADPFVAAELAFSVRVHRHSRTDQEVRATRHVGRV